MIAYEPIRRLSAADRLDAFDCGQPALNQYLQRFALTNQKAKSARSYVVCLEGAVVGFYSLAIVSVVESPTTPRVIKGQSRHSVPVMLLAKLAVDNAHKRIGLGRALLKDALIRTTRAADKVGIRALLVLAKDEDARNWYLQWEFEPSASDPYHLFLPTKDLKTMLPT